MNTNSHDPQGVISDGSQGPDIEMQGRLPRDANHTPTPWHWVIHDSSMASIEGPKSEWDHVLSISPCKHCQGEDWKWGACTVASEADADFIIKAVNSHDALVKALRQIEQLSDNCINAERYTAENALNDLSGIRNVIKSLTASVGGPAS